MKVHKATMKNFLCDDKGLQRLCAYYRGLVPCCDAVTRDGDLPRERGKVLSDKADCVDLFELKKELLGRKSFRFKAVSWCMFPVIKRNDVLEVVDMSADELKVGDIPAYKSGDKLFAHRVVGKKNIAGKHYIITRPDGDCKNTDSGTGEMIPEEDVLGKITEIHRARAKLPTDMRGAYGWERVLFRKAVIQAKIKRSVIHAGCIIIDRIQSLRLYGLIGKNLIRLLKTLINFHIVTPSNNRLRIYTYKPLAAQDLNALKTYSNFNIMLKLGNIPIGYAAFLNRPEGCPNHGYWLSDLYIRLRYRRIGFETILENKAREVLLKSGVKPRNPFTGDGI